MVKFKKIIALSCAATMLFSSTAFAAGVDDEVNGGGNSVVENDNSTAPRIDRLVLPTMGDNTYDFTIDPEGLLANYDPITYATGESVYFNATKTAAKLAFSDTDAATYGLYVQTKVEDTGLNALTALLSGKTQAEIEAPLAGLDQFFVWVPDTVNVGEGTYEALTPTNLPKVIDLTFTGEDPSDTVDTVALNIESGSQSNLAGDYIWDGKIYTIGYDSITAEEAAAEYYASAAITSGLYVGPTAEVSTGTYTNVAAAVLGSGTGELSYKAAVMQQTGTTDKATIVNKSTFDIGVIAEVTVNDGEGLTFLESSTIAGDDATASVYMAITDGTDAAPVDGESGKATAYYVVKGTGDEAHVYQTMASVGTEPGTGSHVYKQYLTSDQEFSKVDFQITAKANINSVAADAWEEYVETLTAESDAQTKPSIDIVYKFVEIEESEAVTVDGDTPTYFATFTAVDDAIFSVEAVDEPGATAKLAVGGWATYEPGNKGPSVASTELTYSKSSGAAIAIDIGGGELGATGVSKVMFSADGVAFSTDVTGQLTITDSAITIPSGKFAAASNGDVRYYQVIFNDENATKVVVKFTIAD